MLSTSKYINTLYDVSDMQQMLNDSVEITDKLFMNELKDLEIDNYRYSPDVAVEELGLDLELIDQLIEDYVIQILKTSALFIAHIEKLQEQKKNNIELDYKDLRELAHKNLGVARNLRIEDARKLLYRIMKVDDLDYIFKCLEALVASAVILKPKCAFDTLVLMKIKDSL